jgi:hypothetical protein
LSGYLPFEIRMAKLTTLAIAMFAIKDMKHRFVTRLILSTAFALLLLAGVSERAYGQTIPQFRTTDWSLAGNHYDFLAHGGNVISVLSYGATGNGITDDSQAINAALLALGGTGSTLYFPPGTYLINGFLSLPDSITLLGSGADSTILLFYAGEHHDALSVSGNAAGSYVAVTGGYQKNSKQIMVADSNVFVPGDFAGIIQDGTQHMTSAWAMESLGQMVVIDSVDGNMLYLNQPLRMDYNSILSPRIRRINARTAVSIECLQIRRADSTTSQTSNIGFDFARDCRVLGVESKQCNFAHVDIRRSTGITIRGSYFHEGHSYGVGGKAYGVCVNATSGACLVENNIFRKLRHSMLLQSGANGNVFGYNYSTDPYWADTLFPTDAAGDIVLHGNYPYLNLFEGNIVQNIVIDDSHGKNGHHNTFFRNRAELYGIFMNNNPATDSVNFAGNEIPNSVFPLGLYFLNGNNHFQYGNNIKGVITPREQEHYRMSAIVTPRLPHTGLLQTPSHPSVFRTPSTAIQTQPGIGFCRG